MTHEIGSGELYDPGQAVPYHGKHDPIAYTYEADTHCPDCAATRFGCDENDFITGTDGEGNPVGVISPWDEWIQGSGTTCILTAENMHTADDCTMHEYEGETLACGTCGTVIDEYEGGEL